MIEIITKQKSRDKEKQRKNTSNYSSIGKTKGKLLNSSGNSNENEYLLKKLRAQR